METCGLLSAVIPAVQRQNQWCWAACIEMALRCNGHLLPQAQIVKETWGEIVNMPATGPQILAAINRSYKEAQGRFFAVTGRMVGVGEGFIQGAHVPYRELAEHRPVIVAGNGHAMMLRKLVVRRDNVGSRTRFVSAQVLDPWPGSGIHPITEPEWNDLYFLATVTTT